MKYLPQDQRLGSLRGASFPAGGSSALQPFYVGDIFKHRALKAVHGTAGAEDFVFVCSRALRKTDRYESSAWLCSCGSGSKPKRLTSKLFGVKNPLLDAAGRQLAFLSKREGSRSQIQIMPLTGGEARQLTASDDTLSSLEMWSPDGGALLVRVAIAWAEDQYDEPDDKHRPHVVSYLPYKQDGSGTIVGSRVQLWRALLRDGTLQPLIQGDFDVSEAQWSPDGRWLAYVRNRSGKQRHRTDVWLASADGGDPRQLTDSLASVSGIRWSPSSDALAFAGSREEGDSLRHLYLIRPDSGELSRPADNHLHLEGSALAWHPDGDRIAAIASHRGAHEIVIVDVPNERIQPVRSRFRQVLGLSPVGDRIAFVAATMRTCEEIYSMRWDGADERRHTGFNRRWLRNKARPRVTRRRFEVPDGVGGSEKIDAWLLLPPGSGPFPLLLDLHGGPQSTVLIDYASHAYWYALVSQGWAVLAPNAVGSGGYGEDFAKRLRGCWGELDLPQHMAIIDRLQSEGVADTRLACTGKSYGGFLTAWAIGQSHRFKAAVICAPVTNIESHAGTSDTGYYVTPYAMDGEITDQRARCHALSPIQYCHRVETPTLLLQGADDARCPLGQSEEMFANLVRCGQAPQKMVVYPGGSHSLAASGRPSHRLDYHRRLVDWVQEHAQTQQQSAQ